MSLWLMMRLHRISGRRDSFDAFLQSFGIPKGTLWKLMRGEGNPAASLSQRIAQSQRMSFVEVLSLDPLIAKAECEKVGIDAERFAGLLPGSPTRS